MVLLIVFLAIGMMIGISMLLVMFLVVVMLPPCLLMLS